MSQQLINHSSDLKQLRDDGYTISIQGNVLVIEDIPYVNQAKKVLQGTLISKLTTAGTKASYQGDHVVYFIGEQPCYKDGHPMSQIMHTNQTINHTPSIISNLSFSSKPAGGYRDYHHKMSSYINILSSQAVAINPETTPKRYKPIQDLHNETVFKYIDTNSSRASISQISNVLAGYKVGIVGLGGSGSYILDMIAKTPAQEIHLFDGDKFLAHNAFRAPGAASIQSLDEEFYKVEYFKDIYSNMHKNIHAHAQYISSENLEMLKNLNFVFIAIDIGSVKAEIFTFLENNNIPYVDVGMGIEIVDNKLQGSLRTSSIFSKDQYYLKKHIDMSNDNDNVYSSNIQIAELNALNASMAVISWKKHAGFYHETIPANATVFTVDTFNIIRTGA
jgi:hypothetical protein